MPQNEHYFDWAATSPADEQILRQALELSMENYGNPSSIHQQGVKARKLLDDARQTCAKALGVKAENLYFTSGGTESDHIPLLSLLNKNEKGKIIISAIEHPALREQCEKLSKTGFTVETVVPDSNGFIDPEKLIEKVTPDTLFVTVMACNNETGCVQNIYRIADLLKQKANGKKKPHFHIDCVQAAGKIPLEISYDGIDSAAFSAHKICGPRGIGLLYLAKTITPFLTGGGQEKNIRSGTENLFGAIALSKCLEKYWISDKESQSYKRYSLQKKLTENFINEINSTKVCTIVPSIRVTEGETERFSPYVVQAAFKGIPGNVMVRALDAKGFCISTGSACSAKKQSRPILQAMNVTRDIQDTAVRFSFGPESTQKGIEDLILAVKEICKTFC